SAHRQSAAMAQATVGAQVHQALDGDADLASQVALHHELADLGAQALDLGLGKVTDLGAGRDLCDLAHLHRTRAPDTENTLKPDPDMFLDRKVDTRNARHGKRSPESLIGRA